jgi:hypothetical protein
MITAILATFAWTTVLHATSLALPLFISAKKGPDVVDRTVGQVVRVGAQALIVIGVSIDLVTPIGSLTPLVIGFYLYDMIHLATKPYGTSQHMFQVHHALTIALAGYLDLIDTPYKVEVNLIYILLETSSTALNAVCVLKSYCPVPVSVSTANVAIYGITRIVLYPIVVGRCVLDVFKSDTLLINVFPICMLSTLYVACFYWFLALVRKHSRDYGGVAKRADTLECEG